MDRSGKKSFSEGRLPAALSGGKLSGEAGFSMILVLWVLAMVMLLAAEFAYTVRVESSTVRNLGNRTAAYYLAVSGVEKAMAELPGQAKIVHYDGNGRLVFRSEEGKPPVIVETEKEFAFGGGKVRYEIYDEKARFNVNLTLPGGLETILKHGGLDELERDIVVDSVEDWKDVNHEHHLNGAEDDYYASLPRPYGAKDGGLHSAEELLLVKGVTPEIFYGKERVPEEFGSMIRTDVPYSGISKFLTASGDGRLNINTASEPVLEAFYGKGRAAEIRLRLSTEGFFEKPVYGGSIASDSFTIVSTGTYAGASVSVKATVKAEQGTGMYTVSYWNEGALAAY